MQTRHLLAAVGLAATPFLPARAQDAASGVSVHGYLTQGWAVSKGAKHYGMDAEPSTDFRYAALQVRYDRDANGFLLQFNHRRLGKSPITDFESDVTLNWAFYERRFGQEGSLRVGRVPVPRGIYNEQRSIGVLLPFYRAPVIFYDEGAYFSETIDGVVASQTFFVDRPWSLEVNAYAGGWSLLGYDQYSEEFDVDRARADNAVGAQLWLGTPVQGLRFGVAAQRYDWLNVSGDPTADASGGVREFQGSLDLTRARGFLRAETELQDLPDDDYYASYVQAGVRLLPKLLLVGQYEWATERNQTWASDWPSNFEWHRSLGVGANWSFTPSLVAKLEYHRDRGIQVEQRVPHPDVAPRFRYVIASLSASF